MATPNKLEWSTSLRSISETLVKARDTESRDSRWGADEVKPLVDELTVAELREVSTELDNELERLRRFSECIRELKERLKEVAAV